MVLLPSFKTASWQGPDFLIKPDGRVSETEQKKILKTKLALLNTIGMMITYFIKSHFVQISLDEKKLVENHFVENTYGVLG